MAILGLLSTESFAAERFKSVRRSVFYQYPNGAAPLLGLLSMLDGEVLNDPEFSWYEDRYKQKVQLLVVNGTTSGPWYADNAGALGAAAATTAATKTAGTAYWLRVNGYDTIRANDVLKFTAQITGGTAELQVKVLPNSSGVWYDATDTGYIRVTPLNTRTAVTNIYTEYGATTELLVLGNANYQGQVGSAEGSYSVPTSHSNATQIFRTPYSFTGTALKTALKFDESGPYKDKAKKSSISHMVQMELQFFFGEYSKTVDSTSGLPCFTTGGILFFLRLWEVGVGNTVAGVTSTYDVAASTQNSDDNKRIININGNITDSALDDYYERLFRKTNNIANEKMAFVGSGFLNVINKLYKSKVELKSDLPLGDTYGMNVVKHQTPFGVVFYKTHPLFSENASMRYNALFLDVQNLHYRHMQDRDTTVKKNIQPNDADYRKDEWFTEAGFEMQFPESHMYMVGVTGVA
jgi:hypothetical protein